MNKSLLLIFLIVIFLSVWVFKLDLYSYFVGTTSEAKYSNKLTINGNVINVDIADTFGKRGRGLSGRESMQENQGMLFVFSSPNIHSFWMKDMNFPLDFIWIDEKLKIAQISSDISPNTYPRSIFPDIPTKYVLEVNSGWSSRHDIRIGDKIEIEVIEKDAE